MRDFHTPELIASVSRELQAIMSDFYLNVDSRPAYPHIAKQDVIDAIHEPEIPRQGQGLTATLREFRERIVPTSVRTWHPRFMNQMFAGAPLPGAIGDFLVSMANPTLATWEMGPAATIIERDASQWMAQILGMPHGSSGIFLPGGSLSNLLGLTVARNQRLDTHVVSKGMRHEEKQGVILCSDSCHYSMANAANLLGIGKDHLIKVASNERGEMLIDDLRAKLAMCDANDWKPFAVVATMGLTVTGGFDPLGDIVDICRGRGIHIHVDAAFGGGITVTEEGKKLFAGIEHADTAIWDAHKWFHAPLACTALLAPDAGIFKHVFSSNAEYLYHPQEEEIDYADDLGQYTLLCGKRFDALRVWFVLKTFGLDALRGEALERLETVRLFYALLKDDPDFEPSYEPVSPIMCFRYRPKETAGFDNQALDKLQRWIREESKRRELGMFNIARFKGYDHLRAILINPLATLSHVKDTMAAIRELGREYLAKERDAPLA